MSRKYYGATIAAQRIINDLLSLPSTGREQDWELELADPNRIEDMLSVASTAVLSHDGKCALALILIASIEEAIGSGLTDPNLVERSRKFLQADENVLQAMRFFWIDQGQASDEDFVKSLLT